VKPKTIFLVASYGKGEEDDPIVINDTEWEPAGEQGKIFAFTLSCL